MNFILDDKREINENNFFFIDFRLDWRVFKRHRTISCC